MKEEDEIVSCNSVNIYREPSNTFSIEHSRSHRVYLQL
jgi:hypothetical protein